ncbi:MAG: bifunctional acetate--CoA ligase family protein/GNAT family N-acetyltransferase [Lewinellaceae bacterium]|nr:bifunctional acetate--CoA ligase family protein/GNAT family N-acetyltransferase [Lewinellaceae bacterium]
MKKLLDKFFYPKSVALVGATEKPEKIGYTVLRNLLENGYGGSVYPVNPKYRKLQGKKCYGHLRDLPKAPDLVIFALPAALIPPQMAACREIGAQCAVVIASGFKEAGEEGEQLYRDLKFEAANNGVRLIGPNCIGLLTPAIGLNASFAPAMPAAGRVAFISQSGALGSAILDWAAEKNVGFSHFVSIGSMADIGFDQLIDYFGVDSRTACILIYMENLVDARRFMSAARAFARSKPIVVLKAGSSKLGARAALAHTGALAGNDAVYAAAFRRAGIIRAHTIQQLFDSTQALANQPLPAGNRLAIVTNAGGPSILATDALEKRGGKLAQLSPKTLTTLNKQLSPNWSKSNPLDILADASVDQFRLAVRACLADPNVDAVLTILTAQNSGYAEAVAQAVVEESKVTFDKPVYASWMGLQTVKSGRAILEEGQVPWYPFPERAVVAFMHMVRYRENLNLLHETPSDLPVELDNINRTGAKVIVDIVQKSGRLHFEEAEAKRLLACYGIPINTSYLAKTEDEAAAIARNMGCAVALKIESPDIWYKSEVHGVRLGIETEFGTRQVFRFLMENVRKKRPDARISGVTIEKMVNTQHELRIGAMKDPTFGPVIYFGPGGVATDVLQDRAYGLPPLNMALAKNLVSSTRTAQLLQGYKHLPPVPIEQLHNVLVRFAYLLMDFPEIREIDVNPFAMNPTGGIALDAEITLEQSPSLQRKPYEHLSIQPYPTQWVKTVELKNGQQVLLRPIRPEDEPLEAELVKNTSKESLYFRFFGFVPGIDHKMLARFTHIDYDREMAIVAVIEVDKKPEIIGVVRIVGDGWRESCEYAILVADNWHGRGMGSILTEYIIEIARAQGYHRITATFLKINSAMRRLFQHKGFKIKGGEYDTDLAELALDKKR